MPIHFGSDSSASHPYSNQIQSIAFSSIPACHDIATYLLAMLLPPAVHVGVHEARHHRVGGQAHSARDVAAFQSQLHLDQLLGHEQRVYGIIVLFIIFFVCSLSFLCSCSLFSLAVVVLVLGIAVLVEIALPVPRDQAHQRAALGQLDESAAGRA
ncbi:hypothetical protein IWX49DRAFT_583434 [Phyllosticta citricarpa]|uniref:Uncharacterized protein n=1 Tax=Phyllosticta paracitricarpa TaxID=2016321 RepID=A0ABR1MUM7_9PEZI